MVNLSEYSGKHLTRLLLAIFAVFLIVGLSVGYLVNQIGDENDGEQSTQKDTQENYEGIVSHTNPAFYPQDNISFVLTSSSGKEIILLKATDQKLEVAEGHFVTVYGKKRKTTDDKLYLLVEKIVIKNVSD